MSRGILEENLNKLIKFLRESKCFLKVNKEHSNILFGDPSPFHSFPTSNKILKDIFAFDETGLCGADELREHIFMSKDWNLGKNC